MEKIAAIITNYNMPERTDALVEGILHCVRWPVEVFVVDNGSDLMEPSRYTTIWLEANRQTTGGWLAGLDVAKRESDYLAYWFLITSAEYVGIKDVLTPMAKLLMSNANAVGVHPALTEDSTTAWQHLITRGGHTARATWMIDNIASLWRATWFDANGGFDPELRYGWGIDLELCWKARAQGRSLWVHEGSRIKKVTDVGYAMDRMRMSADERRRLAGENMALVLQGRYGDDWNWRMREEFVTEEMR